MDEARDLPSQAAAPARAGRDERRRAILDVARDIFMQEGYAAASMSAIAARLGGSKGTLYNYFASKELLFGALMQAECEAEPWKSEMDKGGGDDLPAALSAIGERFLDFVLTPSVMDIHRLVIAESGRFPELGRTFYENGPKRSMGFLGAFMADEMAAGRLKAADPERIAMQFVELCKSGLHQKMLWNVEPAPSAEARAANVAAAVGIFMAVYGADAAENSQLSDK
jgi:TetR/AcrR family transcriptional repressor of mexJK operon